MIRKLRRRAAFGLASVALLAVAGIATAAPRTEADGYTPRITVGVVRSQLVCSIFESYWGTWLVIECRNNFAAIRSRIASTLAEAQAYRIVDEDTGAAPAARYIIDGNITELGIIEDHYSDDQVSQGGAKAVGVFDFNMRDGRSGEIIFGKTIRKTIDMDVYDSGARSSYSSGRSPQAIYQDIQRELALEVARHAVFYDVPLRVVYSDGRNTIGLNYGTPLLPIGTVVQVNDEGGRSIKFRVSGATPTGAEAERMGNRYGIICGKQPSWSSAAGGDGPACQATASVIEKDDPAFLAPADRKVDLPL